jgi:hypothetical protein
MAPPADWRAYLLETEAQIDALLATVQRVVVLGIKPARYAERPAYYVAAYLKAIGIEVVPVPVYDPEVTEILGERVYRRVEDVPGAVDIVNVFRRSADVPAYLDALRALRPRCVWLQSGIRHDEVAEALARAGIAVVQDRCLMVEMRRRGR